MMTRDYRDCMHSPKCILLHLIFMTALGCRAYGSLAMVYEGLISDYVCKGLQALIICAL
jgi:hypothetical protein